MKNKYVKCIPMILGISLIMSGCAEQAGESVPLSNPPSQTTITQTVGESSLSPTHNSTAASAAEADAYSEAFSARDLSGEYDASQAVAITLKGSGVSADSEAVQIDGSQVTITAAGTYILSGKLDQFTVNG